METLTGEQIYVHHINDLKPYLTQEMLDDYEAKKADTLQEIKDKETAIQDIINQKKEFDSNAPIAISNPYSTISSVDVNAYATISNVYITTISNDYSTGSTTYAT